MAIIYQRENAVLDHDPQDSSWTAWAVPDEYVSRLMAGERPKSWEMLLLPDFDKFIDLSSFSEAWGHIQTHSPLLASNLFTALVAKKHAIIQGMMTQIAAALGTDHALHSTSSATMIDDPNDPEGLPIPIGTLADELDAWLSQCHFGFTYNDLLNPPQS